MLPTTAESIVLDSVAEPRPIKRFKSARTKSVKSSDVIPLVSGFHWEGDYPSVITNSNGEIVAVSKGVIDCPGPEYFFQWIHRKSDTLHVCLLCPLDSPVSSFATQQNKTSNIITHIKLSHAECISAYQHMSDVTKSRTAKEWEFRVKNPDIVQKPQAPTQIKPLMVQSNLDQFHPLPIGIQKAFWAKVIALGNLSCIHHLDVDP